MTEKGINDTPLPCHADERTVTDFLRRVLNLVGPVRIGQADTKVPGRYHFRGKIGGKDVFVKWFGGHGSGRRETMLSGILHRNRPDHFSRPFVFDADWAENCFVCEFAEGKRLDTLIRENGLTDEDRESVVRQLREIAEMFLETGIIHGDFSFKNLILSGGRLVVIDVEKGLLAASCDENELIGERIRKRGLLVGRLKFDDFPDMLHFLKQIGPRPAYRALYDEVESELKRHVGKLAVETRFVFHVSVGGLYALFRNAFLQFLTCFIPVKRWRKRFRQKYVYRVETV